MFDSGSSCSNEECWEVNHDHTGKNYGGNKGKILPLSSSMTTSLSSQSKVLTSSQSIEKVKLINGKLLVLKEQYTDFRVPYPEFRVLYLKSGYGNVKKSLKLL